MSIIYTDQQKAEAVLVYRFTYGLSLDECAKQLGITSSALCHWNEEFEEIIIDEEDYEIADDHILEKRYSKVTAANASGKVSSKSINVLDHSNIVEKTRSIRVMNDNDGLLDNIIASANQSTVKIMVQKEFIDSSDLTLNKEYVVKMDEIYNYEDYNGRYLLTRKRDIFIRTDDQFTSTTMLMLDKVSE